MSNSACCANFVVKLSINYELLLGGRLEGDGVFCVECLLNV